MARYRIASIEVPQMGAGGTFLMQMNRQWMPLYADATSYGKQTSDGSTGSIYYFTQNGVAVPIKSKFYNHQFYMDWGTFALRMDETVDYQHLEIPPGVYGFTMYWPFFGGTFYYLERI